MDDEECHYGCGRPGTTRDHVIPRGRNEIRSKNGRRKATGFSVLSCHSCNNARATRPYPQYAAALGVSPQVIIATMLEAIRIYETRFGVPAPRKDRQALQQFQEVDTYGATHIRVIRGDKTG